MNKGKCRSCQAPVLWVTMAESGRNNPLDPEPVTIPPEKPECASLVEIGADGMGRIVKGRKGYASHYSTCPQSQAWRKKSNGTPQS